MPSSKQRYNFGTILTKLGFPKRFSRKSPIYAFNEIHEIGATLTKRQANKYKTLIGALHEYTNPMHPF